MEGIKLPIPEKPIKFIDQLRRFIRLDGKSYATENTYVHWVKRYIFYHGKQHPAKLNKEHIELFLTHLAIQCGASENTQKTALNALVFLYNRFLKITVGELASFIVSATRIKRHCALIERRNVFLRAVLDNQCAPTAI